MSNKARMNFSMTLRGMEVDIQCSILAPEPDVGLDGYGIDDIVIVTDNGGVDWDLTDAEYEQIAKTASDHAYSAEGSLYEHDCDER